MRRSINCFTPASIMTAGKIVSKPHPLACETLCRGEVKNRRSSAAGKWKSKVENRPEERKNLARIHGVRASLDSKRVFSAGRRRQRTDPKNNFFSVVFVVRSRKGTKKQRASAGKTSDERKIFPQRDAPCRCRGLSSGLFEFMNLN